jgi:hypothetical protein
MEVLLVGIEQLYVQWDESHINEGLALAGVLGELAERVGDLLRELRVVWVSLRGAEERLWAVVVVDFRDALREVMRQSTKRTRTTRQNPWVLRVCRHRLDDHWDPASTVYLTGLFRVLYPLRYDAVSLVRDPRILRRALHRSDNWYSTLAELLDDLDHLLVRDLRSPHEQRIRLHASVSLRAQIIYLLLHDFQVAFATLQLLQKTIEQLLANRPRYVALEARCPSVLKGVQEYSEVGVCPDGNAPGPIVADESELLLIESDKKPCEFRQELLSELHEASRESAAPNLDDMVVHQHQAVLRRRRRHRANGA